jgi:hypothetical protein
MIPDEILNNDDVQYLCDCGFTIEDHRFSSYTYQEARKQSDLYNISIGRYVYEVPMTGQKETWFIDMETVFPFTCFRRAGEGAFVEVIKVGTVRTELKNYIDKLFAHLAKLMAQHQKSLSSLGEFRKSLL